MAGKHLIDGKLCVVRVNVQSSLERFEQGEDGGGGKLKARMLTTENNGRLAIFGPGCYCCWGLQLASRGSGVAAPVSGVRLLFCGTCGLTTSFTPSNKVATCGVCP